MQIRQTFAPLLAAAVAAVALWSGIAPTDRAVWWAEVTPIFIVYGALLVSARWFRFSNLAYALMSGWMLLHLVGAHYTFANVPFEWGNRLLSPLLGESRTTSTAWPTSSSASTATPWPNGCCAAGSAAWRGLLLLALLHHERWPPPMRSSSGSTPSSTAGMPASSSWARRATSGTPRRTCWPTRWAH